MLVEQKQRMVTEACKVAVVGRALLPAVGLTDRAVQIQDEFFERWTLSIQRPGSFISAVRLRCVLSVSVSKRPTSLLDAACLSG